MKVILVWALMLGFSHSALAEDTSKKVPVKEGYQTMDMKLLTPPGEPTQAKNSKVPTKIGCLDNTGRTIAQGEPGFETCVMNRVPKNPGDQPTNMNIQFGQ